MSPFHPIESVPFLRPIPLPFHLVSQSLLCSPRRRRRGKTQKCTSSILLLLPTSSASGSGNNKGLFSDFSSHFHTERVGSTEREREERSPFCSTLGQKGRRGRGVGAKRGRGIVTSSPSPTTTCLYRHRSLWPFDDTLSHTHGWLHGHIKKERLSFCPLTGFPLISFLLHSTVYVHADSLNVKNGERAKVACSAPPTDESRDPFPFSSSSSHPLRAYGPFPPSTIILRGRNE